MKKTGVIVLLFILINTLLSAHDENIKVQLKFFHQYQFAGFYAAVEKGYYKQEGLDVQLVEGKPGTDFVEEVVFGNAQYGVEMPDIIIKRSEGMPVVILSAIFQHSPYIFLVRKDSGIQFPHHLKGKRIMIRKDSAAELKAMILKEGLSFSDVEMVPHTWDYNDLIDGKVDAVGAYSYDQPYFLDQRNVEYGVIHPKNYGIDFYGDCIFTSEEEIRKHPDRVIKFLKATKKGWQYAIDNPDQTIDIILKRYNTHNLTKDYLKFQYEGVKELIMPEFVSIGHVNKGRWKHIETVFKDLGMLKKDVDLNEFIYDPEGTTAKIVFARVIRYFIVSIFLIIILALAMYFGAKKFQKTIKERTDQVLINQENYGAIFNSTNDAIFIHEVPSGKVIDVNNKMVEMYGFKKEEAIGMTPDEFGEMNPELAKEKITLAIGGEAQIFEFPAKRKNGTTFPVEVNLKAAEYGGKKVLIAVVRNMEERNRYKLELLEKEEFYRYVTEKSDDFVAIYDNNGVIKYVTPSYYKITGHKPEEVVGKQVGSLLAESSRQKAQDIFRGFLAGGYRSLNGVELELVNKNGKSIPIEVNALNMFGDNPVNGLLVNGRDVSKRKDIESTIRLQSDLIDQVHDSIVSIDMDGYITSWNKATEKMLGYTSSEVLGKHISEFYPEEDQEFLKTGIIEPLMKNGVNEVENRMKKKDGSILTGNLKLTMLKNSSGKNTGMIGNMEDITERKSSEEMYRILFNTANDSIFLMAGDKFIDCNDKTLEMFGVKRDDIINHSPVEFSPEIQPDGLSSYDKALTKINGAMSGESQIFEWKHKKKTGEEFWAEVSLNSLMIKGAAYVQAIVRDIDERKEAESLIRKSEERFRDIVENTNDVIFELDKDGKYAYQSDGFYRILGKKVSETIGKSFVDYIYEQDRSYVLEEFQKVIVNNIPAKGINFRMIHADGSIKYVEVSGVAILDNEGNVIGARGTGRDVTERLTAQNEIQKTLEELKRSNEDLEQFAYISSHDMREPLRMITSYVQMLEHKYKGKLDNEADEYIGYIVKSVERMRNLIKDILMYAKAGRFEEEKSHVDLYDVTEEVIDSMQKVYPKTKIVNKVIKNMKVYGDASQLAQVFTNIIGNGLKFNKSNTPEVVIESKKADNEVLLSFTDNGIGLDPKYSDKVFEMFQSLYRYVDYEGSGIGLAICKKIVERHNGRIWFESDGENRGGTVFYISLPY